MSAKFAGSADYSAAIAMVNFVITPAVRTVQVIDAGGTYDGSAFAATATVVGVNGLPATTLEGIAPVLSYYGGTYTSASQLSDLTPLSAAPTEAGSYTVSANFVGSADYVAAVSLANFAITPAIPTVQVVDTGRDLRRISLLKPRPRLTGVNGRLATTLEGIAPALSYYSGTYTIASQLSGLIPLSTAPTEVGIVHGVGRASLAAPTTATGSRWRDSRSRRRLQRVQVIDTGGTYDGSAFAATATVAGVNGPPAATLEGIAPALSYYSWDVCERFAALGTHAPERARPPGAGSYTVSADFAGSADYSAAASLANFADHRGSCNRAGGRFGRGPTMDRLTPPRPR